jgi:drug/metabolite transporter superfamily protein YnfA
MTNYKPSLICDAGEAIIRYSQPAFRLMSRHCRLSGSYAKADKYMRDRRSRLVAPIGLVIGAVFGMVGTFVTSASLRGVLWGIDGIALIIATALLTTYHLRRGNEVVAAGFLVFVAGETLILCTAAMDPVASSPVFAAGVGLWAASLTIVSVPNVMPLWIRAVSAVAALLFAAVAVQVFMGHALTLLSQPLPFFAYPFLVAALFGWAWAHYRNIV